MCTQLVLQVLTDLGTNCANMESNTACYGFEVVEAAFMEEVPDDFFAEPADRAELTSLVTLATDALDADESIWGIGAMRVQTNVHNALPDQAVFIAVGDVVVENAVQPETALLPVEPVSITTIAGGNLYKAPDAASESLGTVPSGTTLQVDGLSEDGLWMRALYFDGTLNQLSWVSADMLDTTVDTSGLPLINDESRSPMQVFFLRNGLDHPECAIAAPPLLVVQSPKDTEVDIIVNGAHIRLGSTIVLRVLLGDMLRVTTLSGMATINPGTQDQLLVPPGFHTSACLSLPGSFGGLNEEDDDQIVSCPWSSVEMVTPDEVSELDFIGNLPDNVVLEIIGGPIIVDPSGVGNANSVLFFTDPDVLDEAQLACDSELLSNDVCRRLFY